jgi:hypothetical protein
MTDDFESSEPPAWPITVEAPPVTLVGWPSFADDARMLMALGAVVRGASKVDYVLRDLYCALVGSPYAAVTAGGSMTSWLLGECDALVRSNREIGSEGRGRLLQLISEVKSLASERNRFVHDVWVTGLRPGHRLMRSRNSRYEMDVRAVHADDLVRVANGFERSAVAVSTWIIDNLGYQAAGFGSQLRFEEEDKRRSDSDPDAAQGAG